MPFEPKRSAAMIINEQQRKQQLKQLEQQQRRQPAVTTISQPHPAGWRLEDEDPPPTNYLALSVFNGLCCCTIFGIIAIVLSIQSRNAAEIGKSAHILRVNFDRPSVAAFFVNAF